MLADVISDPLAAGVVERIDGGGDLARLPCIEGVERKGIEYRSGTIRRDTVEKALERVSSTRT